VTLSCDSTPLTIQIVGLGPPVDVDGGILITPAQPIAPPTTSAPRSQPSSEPGAPATAHPTGDAASAQPHASASPSTLASKPAAAAPSAALSSRPASPVAVAAQADTASPAPAVVDASDTRSSSSPALVAGILIAVVVLVAAGWAGWRWKVRRPGDTAAEVDAETSAADPTQEVE
jgi:hypothetical protein